jgi:hypothetical protein
MLTCFPTEIFKINIYLNKALLNIYVLNHRVKQEVTHNVKALQQRQTVKKKV